MIDHAWTVLCKKAIVDPQTGNATLVETLEQINATGPPPQFPTLAPIEMDLVSLWYRSDIAIPAQGQGRVTLLGPNGAPITQPQAFQIDLTTFLRCRTITRLPGLPVTGAGVYFFQVELRVNGQDQWHDVARVPVQFTIEQTTPSPVATQSEVVN